VHGERQNNLYSRNKVMEITIEGVEFVVEEKIGMGYRTGEAIQVYPKSGEYPKGGMLGEVIAEAVRPGCIWSYSGKDLNGFTLVTVLIFN
jgi:hypothetical protein